MARGLAKRVLFWSVIGALWVGGGGVDSAQALHSGVEHSAAPQLFGAVTIPALMVPNSANMPRTRLFSPEFRVSMPLASGTLSLRLRPNRELWDGPLPGALSGAGPQWGPLSGEVEGEARSWVRMSQRGRHLEGLVFVRGQLYELRNDPERPGLQRFSPVAEHHEPRTSLQRAAAKLRCGVDAFDSGPGGLDEDPEDNPTGDSGTGDPTGDPSDSAGGSGGGVVAQERPRQGALAAGTCELIDISLVADYSHVKALGGEMASKQEMMRRINEVDGMFRLELDLGLKIREVVTFPQAGGPRFNHIDSPDIPLEDIETWKFLNQADHGLTHLFVARRQKGIVGNANIGTICHASKGVAVSNYLGAGKESTMIVAHGIGHNFGADHDGKGRQTVMAPLIAAQHSGFSLAALARIAVARELAHCLKDCEEEKPKDDNQDDSSSDTGNDSGSTSTSGEDSTSSDSDNKSTSSEDSKEDSKDDSKSSETGDDDDATSSDEENKDPDSSEDDNDDKSDDDESSEGGGDGGGDDDSDADDESSKSDKSPSVRPKAAAPLQPDAAQRDPGCALQPFPVTTLGWSLGFWLFRRRRRRSAPGRTYSS